MKSNNSYLKKIVNNTGSNMSNKSNNIYLREIAKNTGSDVGEKHHSDNYYLGKIASNTFDIDTSELQEALSEKTQRITELEIEVETLESTMTTALNNANNRVIFGNIPKIIQVDDEIELSVTVLNDGKLVTGQTVEFYKEE